MGSNPSPLVGQQHPPHPPPEAPAAQKGGKIRRRCPGWPARTPLPSGFPGVALRELLTGAAREGGKAGGRPVTAQRRCALVFKSPRGPSLGLPPPSPTPLWVENQRSQRDLSGETGWQAGSGLGGSGRAKPRGSPRRLSPHLPTPGPELLPASLGGGGRSERPPSESPGRWAEVQHPEQRPTEGSWSARLPWGGGGPPGPPSFPLSSSLSSPPSTQRPGRRSARAEPTSPTVPKLPGALCWELGGERKERRRRRAPWAPWTRFRNPPPPPPAARRLGPEWGGRQAGPLARSLRRTAPAWRRFPLGVRTGRAAPPSLPPSRRHRLPGGRRARAARDRSDRASSAASCAKEGKVASGCCPRRTPAADSRIRPRRRRLGGRGK